MAEHGTIARARKHRDEGERPKDCCPECYKAELDYQKEYRKGIHRRKKCRTCGGGINKTQYDRCQRCRKRQKERPRCGTKPGYLYHIHRLKETPCDKCIDHMEKFKELGTFSKPCINPGCIRQSKTADEYCSRCRHGAIVGWQLIKGIQKPIYHIEGSYRNGTQKAQEAV